MLLNPVNFAKKISSRIKGSKSYANPMQVEKTEQTFYINYLRPGMTVFDVGGNIGELTLLFSRFVGRSGAVHTFEASKATFNQLETVCKIANRSQVVLNNKAVADKEGVLQLHVYDDEHSGWNTLANRPLEKYGIDVKPIHLEEVVAVTIDEYCVEKGITKIDLLKIDIEGAEYQALLGARKMLKQKKIKCIIFEFGQTTYDMGNDPQDIQKYLTSLGYSIKNIVSKDPIFPKQGNTACFSIHIANPLN
ncbi:MAG: FkbM family methyltransferase [Cyanobacteria bacterium RI_101]|nr:FkbM family methyltransferase [Cyanobacteria bacterium RI_101]